MPHADMQGVPDITPKPRRVRVDFNNIISTNVLPIPANGETFLLGERLEVFDDDTRTYEALVLGAAGDTIFLEIEPENT